MTDNLINQDEDIVPEEDTDNFQDQFRRLRQKLKECEALKQEYLDGWQRAKAEFVNARKKDEEEKKSFVKFASQNLILEIIPVIDGLEMATRDGDWQKMPKEWKIGVENSIAELKKILKKNGLEEDNPEINSEFNPNFQEAVSMETVKNSDQDHKIIRVIQRGYRLNSKIIRPAKVVVGEYKE